MNPLFHITASGSASLIELLADMYSKQIAELLLKPRSVWLLASYQSSSHIEKKSNQNFYLDDTHYQAWLIGGKIA